MTPVGPTTQRQKWMMTQRRHMVPFQVRRQRRVVAVAGGAWWPTAVCDGGVAWARPLVPERYCALGLAGGVGEWRLSLSDEWRLDFCGGGEERRAMMVYRNACWVGKVTTTRVVVSFRQRSIPTVCEWCVALGGLVDRVVAQPRWWFHPPPPSLVTPQNIIPSPASRCAACPMISGPHFFCTRNGARAYRN
jgi:hypothetical protein